MTRQEHITQLERDLKCAKICGDYIGADDARILLEDLKKITDKEYESYIKVKKMYAEHSKMSGIIKTGLMK